MRATVLFIDDEAQILEGIRDALRREKLDVITATSGAEGLAILAKRKVDVVVSDERMPGMSGSEFLATVRRRHPGTVRIMLTGHASLEAAVRAINDGEIYRFLTKPTAPADLARTINDGLRIRQLMEQAARLLDVNREQRGLLDELERDHPGITRVERSADGCITLDVTDGDMDQLILEMRGGRKADAPVLQGPA
jgi:DNA-binding NtrC family response regulator